MADRMVGLFHDIKMQGVGILVVEHDRSMMAGLTDCIYELRGAQLFPLGENG
jgi:ABC-type Mn2+/Zn2+ transport system ATPase subunit